METYSEQISYCESTNLVGFLSEWEYQQGEKWKFLEHFKTIKGSIIDGDCELLLGKTTLQFTGASVASYIWDLILDPVLV